MTSVEGCTIRVGDGTRDGGGGQGGFHHPPLGIVNGRKGLECQTAVGSEHLLGAVDGVRSAVAFDLLVVRSHVETAREALFHEFRTPGGHGRQDLATQGCRVSAEASAYMRAVLVVVISEPEPGVEVLVQFGDDFGEVSEKLIVHGSAYGKG